MVREIPQVRVNLKYMKKALLIILALMANLSLFAQRQESQDSLVWLMSAKSAKMVDVQGASYRKVTGPARFLHNGTYLLCDTALWNVETKVIDAWGHVSIIQDETVLTSDKLTYLVEQDLAQFRGSVVQLTDKDHNTLRTRHLDYNTKDSVAIFMNGGSMRDKDGQIIESRNGTYDSKSKRFVFENDVNMFTDSIFVKTKDLLYESELNLATFGAGTNAWKEDNMLSSEAGWYDRGRELFFFRDNVHVMTPDQEGWCDSLYFYRNTSDVEMLGRAQVTDTTRNVFALAGKITYQDTLSKVTLTRKPAVITQTEEKDGSVDTVYLGAEKLVYFSQRYCDIDSLAVVEAQTRLSSLNIDPVGEFRKKAAEEAAKAAAEDAKNDPNYLAQQNAKAAKAKTSGKKSEPRADEPRSELDTIAVADTTEAVVEVEQPDTTKIGFLEALRNVRIYKKNMQVVCDSLVYSDLDSLARLFKEPLIWQEKTRQYTADSISVVISNGVMDKANLMSNAFIAIMEDSTHFNQIKSTEMMAYFDNKGGLKRFDALGGSSALFYIEENEALATVNKTDSKMMSAIFKDGELQRIYYYEAPKNDGYPVVQLSEEEKKLKGFNWQPEKRPADRNAVTPLSLRPTERRSYTARPRAEFRQTDIYYPGYMKDVYRQIAVRDSLRALREREKELAEANAAEQARLDSLALADSLRHSKPIMKPKSDTLSVKDTLKKDTDKIAALDSRETPKVLTPKELKQAKKAEMKAAAEARRKQRIEKKEARWAELDKRDAEKLAAKQEKAKEKERKRKRKFLQETLKQEEDDATALEKYRKQYEKKKARQEARLSK
ncbi:MAG: hypothetical protein IKW20_03290 [Bacteroidales bacterium]|nr:hypothetical protein [Bacteroidales bacterium]